MNKIIIFIILCFSCTLFNKQTPDWVYSKKSNQLYWYGIGTVFKENKKSNDNIRAEARSRAINEIGSQISIKINSSFSQIVEETNYSIDQYKKMIMENRIENSFKNIEFVEFFESKKEYHVLARLSKQKYRETVEKERQNSIELATGFLDRSIDELNKESLSSIVEARNIIMPYLDNPIVTSYPKESKEKVNLYSYINLKFSDYLNRIELIPEYEIIKITIGSSKFDGFKVTCKDKVSGQFISDIPLISYLEDSALVNKSITNKAGEAKFSIPTLGNDTDFAYINIGLDIDEIIQSKIHPRNTEKALINIKVERQPPLIYVAVDEFNIGQKNSNSYAESVVKEFFVNAFTAKYVDKEVADIYVLVDVNTRMVGDKPNEYGIYQTFADLKIKLINAKNNQEIISESIDRVQGADFNSNSESGIKALIKISTKLKKELLPVLAQTLESL